MGQAQGLQAKGRQKRQREAGQQDEPRRDAEEPEERQGVERAEGRGGVAEGEYPRKHGQDGEEDDGAPTPAPGDGEER